MIQKHKLLLNLNFSATSESTNVVNTPTFVVLNGYRINDFQSLGNGIVNPTNVRAFLADENNINDFIINDFFSYLTGNTTTIEFSEIYNSDQKLSDVFNSYYESSIVNNVYPPTSVLNTSLSGTNEITIVENQYFNVNGNSPGKGLEYIPLSINNSTRKLRVYSSITTFTTEESYYIPVFIKRNNKQITKLKFESCDENINLTLNPEIKNSIYDTIIEDNTEINNELENENTPENDAIIVGSFTIT